MRTLLRTALLGLAVLAFAVAPGMQAHLDPGGHLPPFASTGLDLDGSGTGTLDPHVESSDPVQGSGLDRVAGWYVGSAQAAVGPDAALVGLGSLCDLEVVTGTGGAPDEAVVDGSGGNGGLVPDGTFNDGGLGGACHTATFENPDYNTLGCGKYRDPASASYGNARAEDMASGGDVWIATGCDLVTEGHFDCQLFSCTMECTANSLLIANLDAAVGCLLSDCLVVRVVGGPHCDPPGATCGPDGIIDLWVFGEGGGHDGPGVAFPEIPAEFQVCDGDGVAFVLVFDAALVGAGGAEQVSLATSGWIV